jgi:hypothetical protein
MPGVRADRRAACRGGDVLGVERLLSPTSAQPFSRAQAAQGTVVALVGLRLSHLAAGQFVHKRDQNRRDGVQRIVPAQPLRHELPSLLSHWNGVALGDLVLDDGVKKRMLMRLGQIDRLVCCTW